MLKIEQARIQSNSYRPRTQKLDTLVLHYTALDLQSSLRVLRYRDVSVHYVLAEDGTAYKILNDDEVGWHAGVSFWRGRRDVNARSIGIEIVNLDGNLHPFPDVQITALIDLCKKIQRDNPGILAKNIVGHSDVAPKRKVDPGKLFPWQRMAENGIGLWPDTTPTNSVGTTNEIQFLLEKCGYAKPHGYGIKGGGYVFVEDVNAPPAGVTKVVTVTTKDIIRSFQLRYQPDSANGIPTKTTMGMLKSLALQNE